MKQIINVSVQEDQMKAFRSILNRHEFGKNATFSMVKTGTDESGSFVFSSEITLNIGKEDGHGFADFIRALAINGFFM